MEVLKKEPHIHNKTAALVLENGEILWGYGLGEKKAAVGELCFNTSQTGYQEALSDPSYTKQIITFTFPHVGIVGTNQEDQESKKIYADGCVINQPLSEYSNWRAENDLNSYFLKNKIPCIFGIDTRYLTKKLSVEGAKKAAIIHFGEGENKIEKLKTQINEWKGLQNLDLAGIVSTEQNYNWKKGIWKSDKSIKSQLKYNVTCLDFGIKNNYSLVETKSDQYQYQSKNVKINHNLERDGVLSKLKISLIHKKYISSKAKKIDFNDEEIDFLENILQYKNDILNESDILIIAQIMRNILDDFSYEFGYINNEDVYDRVFSNFCIGK